MIKQNSKIAPLIYKPSSINNVTHAVALLKLKQQKYSKYKYEGISKNIEIFQQKSSHFEFDEILEGVMEDKLVEKYKSLKSQIMSELESHISRKIKKKKAEIDLLNFKVKFSPNTEKFLFKTPSAVTFEDEFLFDCYEFIQKEKEAKMFLQESFEKFMIKYMRVNSSLFSARGKTFGEIEMITKFVMLKYNKSEYHISIYEDRYLFAELYCLIRLGRKVDALLLLRQFNQFFDHMHDNFGVSFTNFLNGKEYDNSLLTTLGDDRFKIYLINLMAKHVVSDGFVISSVEDYIFTLLACNKKVYPEDFTNSKVQLLVCLMNKCYKKAAKLLLKEDFSLVAKFFILFELCGVTNYNHFAEESNSTMSVRSTNVSVTEKEDQVAISIFMNFLFAIAQKFSNDDLKIRLIETIQNNDDYFCHIAEFMVKYELYELIKSPLLDRKISESVISLLKKQNKRKLVPLLDFVDEKTYAVVLEDSLEQAILTDKELSRSVDFNKICKNDFHPVLKELLKFYKFNFEPKAENLNELCVFDKNADFSRYKLIIEHIFKSAVSVIKNTENKEFAAIIFRLCGLLELNSECREIAAKELVGLI
ncbi:hypothetical protein NUSPORA_00347 [Nucleospora cyclopteri]